MNITKPSTTRKKRLAYSLGMFVAVGTLIGVIGLSAVRSEADTSGFNAADIIDNSVFTNVGSMNAAQIQAFLNSQVTNCDTNGTQPASDFGRPDLTHAQYAAQQGWAAPPYVCLENYTENGLTAAQIIYNAAQTYQINPQVLLVLLQKEQGLVTDSWPLPGEYTSATGYGCPDSTPGVCNSNYYGFTNQIDNAAYMYHAIMTSNPNWYSPYSLGNNYIQYNPNTSCGGTTLNIQNLATVALYDYTPYQPNAAALAAGFGSGDSCSAYGNRNFYEYFKEWFGSTTNAPYSWSANSLKVYSDSTMTNEIDTNDNVSLASGAKAYVSLNATNVGSAYWNGNVRVNITNPSYTSSNLYDPSWLSNNRATQVSGTVTPGQSTTLSFAISVPQTVCNATYTQGFSLVADGLSSMNDPGEHITVNASGTGVSNVTGNVLQAGTILCPGQSIQNSGMTLVMQGDGNLVLYAPNWRPVWASNTNGNSNLYAVFQSDGNLVVYAPGWRPIWATGTNGEGASFASLQADGNFVLYTPSIRPVWATGTNGQNH